MVLPIFLLAVLPVVTSYLLPIEDPTTSDKFLVSYVNKSIWEHSVTKNKTALSNGDVIALGGDVQCYMPNVTKIHESQPQPLQDPEMQRRLGDTLEAGVKIIDKHLNDQCVLSQSGFWSYKYCGGNDFIQFNGLTQELSQSSLVYTLGRCASDQEDRELQLLFDDYGYYISEIIRGGDVCDVTGSGRLVEVQYVCGNSMTSASLQWTRETMTCQYEAQIIIPELCSLDLLSKGHDKKNALPIICHKNHESLESESIVEMVSLYDFNYIANQFYYLDPIEGAGLSKAMLMYTGNGTVDGLTSPLPSEKVYTMVSDVINRLIGLKLVNAPDGGELKLDATYTWSCDIIDMNGNYINSVKLTVDGSRMAHLLIDRSARFDEDGNFENYSNEKTRSSPNLSHTGEKDKLVPSENNVINLDDLSIENVEYLLNKVREAGRYPDILKNNKNLSDFENDIDDEENDIDDINSKEFLESHIQEAEGLMNDNQQLKTNDIQKPFIDDEHDLSFPRDNEHDSKPINGEKPHNNADNSPSGNEEHFKENKMEHEKFEALQDQIEKEHQKFSRKLSEELSNKQDILESITDEGDHVEDQNPNQEISDSNSLQEVKNLQNNEDAENSVDKDQIAKDREEKLHEEKERLERESQERELHDRLEREHLERERHERERHERLERERHELERQERERQERERQERERQERERQEQEHQERERRERERHERLERERLERELHERLERERLERERLEKERQEREHHERERHERLERERLEKERLEKERLEREILESKRIEIESTNLNENLQAAERSEHKNNENHLDDEL
ncbi:Uncharacterized protein RNJ44_02716 [Nakaseomyces bracarensis]|uniref:Endoplasmic reticulum lectin n=1 Tax=Nakaseomyces bracarensis TaxID=273131 RepID=A0ABR4P018_9SACH